MAGILSPPLTQADVNALMHLKERHFSFLKHHARCYIICKLEREGTLNKNLCKRLKVISGFLMIQICTA